MSLLPGPLRRSRQLLDWAEPLLLPHGRCLFLKGRKADEELTAAPIAVAHDDYADTESHPIRMA